LEVSKVIRVVLVPAQGVTLVRADESQQDEAMNHERHIFAVAIAQNDTGIRVVARGREDELLFAGDALDSAEVRNLIPTFIARHCFPAFVYDLHSDLLQFVERPKLKLEALDFTAQAFPANPKNFSCTSMVSLRLIKSFNDGGAFGAANGSVYFGHKFYSFGMMQTAPHSMLGS
jgi:hypothetical protein